MKGLKNFTTGESLSLPGYAEPVRLNPYYTYAKTPHLFWTAKSKSGKGVSYFTDHEGRVRRLFVSTSEYSSLLFAFLTRSETQFMRYTDNSGVEHKGISAYRRILKFDLRGWCCPVRQR